jgi:hypothetical protein
METKTWQASSALDPSVQSNPFVRVGSAVKMQALQPATSAAPPSVAQVEECSKKGIMLRTGRYIEVGTVVQLQLEREFSLWKIFCCIPAGNCYHLGLEFVEVVH